jgi:hypothetical protein
MGKFNNLSDEALQSVGQRIIRNATARIMRQIPSPRNGNPYATGRLASSFSFTWEKINGEWSLRANYDDHGKYTAFGTRAYFDGAARTVGFFGREFRGYRRGQGGIRPQYWLSLRGDQPVYEAIVEAELRVTYQTFLNNTLSGLSRGTQMN